MKKLMFAAALAAIGTAFAVESGNIVGYSNKSAQQGVFIILGAQFENTDGATKINGLISGVESVVYDEGNVFQMTAAQVQIPNALTGGYDTYYYLTDGWYQDEKGQDAYKPGWCDSEGGLVDSELTPAIALWLRSTPGNATANVAGAVSDDASVDVSCPNVFALRANAFPMPITINSDTMTSENIVGVVYDEGNVFQTTAPQIQVPNASTGGYDTYYYLTDGWYQDEKGQDAYKPGWCDSEGGLVSSTIPVAQGFWTKGTTGAFTLTFTK